jgi:hypothetical protein
MYGYPGGTEEEAHLRLAVLLLVNARRGTSLPIGRSRWPNTAPGGSCTGARTCVRKRHIDDHERLIELHVLRSLGSKRLAAQYVSAA